MKVYRVFIFLMLIIAPVFPVVIKFAGMTEASWFTVFIPSIVYALVFSGLAAHFLYWYYFLYKKEKIEIDRVMRDIVDYNEGKKALDKISGK